MIQESVCFLAQKASGVETFDLSHGPIDASQSAFLYSGREEDVPVDEVLKDTRAAAAEVGPGGYAANWHSNRKRANGVNQ